MNIYRYLLLIYLLSLTNLSFSAQISEKDTVKQIITEILATPEFNTHREQPNLHYVGESEKRGKSTKSSNHSNKFDFLSFFSIIATFFEWLLWISIVVIVGLFIFYKQYWLGQWRLNQVQTPEFIETAEWKMRLLEKNTVLPDNIAEQAWQLWQAGKQVSALSLLYRGALSILNSRDKLAVHASATEGECLHLVKCCQSTGLIDYFSKLTDAWQKTAYSHRLPTNKEVEQLCEQWNNYFMDINRF